LKIRTFPRLDRGKATIVFVVLSYTLITVFMTYPVACQLTSALAGAPMGDAYQHMWSLWWTKKALLDLHISPARLTDLYHPSEPDHPMLVISPFVHLLALPLVLASSPVAAYNVEFLLSFILTGTATYLLCYYFTRNSMASFVGGLVFAFFPNKMLHSMGHLPQITLYLFPIYVLFLFLLLEEPNLRRATSLGVVLALSALVHIIHIAYLLIPCTLVFFVWHLCADRPKILAPNFLKSVAVAFLLACLLTVPLFGPFILDRVSGELTHLQAGGTEAYSADLLNFLTPSLDHPVLGPFLRQLPFPVPGHKDDETLVYVGLVTVFLATVGCSRNWKRRGMWVVLGSVAAILACGPVLKVGGQAVQVTVGGEEWRIPLPYGLLLRLPFYEWGRIPARLLETAMLSLAILASYGAALLLTRLRTLQMRIALVATITVVVLFEYVIVFPFPVSRMPMPTFYKQLAADSEDYAILDVPLTGWRATNTNMYYQVAHGRPIVGGFIYRVPPGVRPALRLFELLVTPFPETDDIIAPLSGPERAALLRRYDVGYVVLHKPLFPVEELSLSIALLESFPGERAYEDEHIVAFPVPSGSGGAVASVPLLAMGRNWCSAEYSDNVPFRWMGNDATIEVWVHEEGEYQLRFEPQPFEGPRHLQIWVDEELVEEYSVDGVHSHTTSPFVLDGGEWTVISFHVPEGCERPSEVLEGSRDGRCLSMLFRQVSIEASG